MKAEPISTQIQIPIEYFVSGHRVTVSDPEKDPRWHPRRGWPLNIPPTSTEAYLSGSHALNLPCPPEQADRGDWHCPWTWWNPTYLGPKDKPYSADLWGSAGTVQAAPGTPQLFDARPVLALIEHPSTKDTKPVYAATVVQAVLDLAWNALAHGHEPPDRRATYRWLSDRGDERATSLAREISTNIDNATQRNAWNAWAQIALQGQDPFYQEQPQPSRLRNRVTTRVNISIQRRQ